MRDIIVTTPKKQMAIAAEETRQCIESGGGFYFRTFRFRPKHMGLGTKIFYVEDGFIRGYGVVLRIETHPMRCGLTGREYDGFHAIMPAESWSWIKPISMRGFQGWHYFDHEEISVVGGWLDERPAT